MGSFNVYHLLSLKVIGGHAGKTKPTQWTVLNEELSKGNKNLYEQAAGRQNGQAADFYKYTDHFCISFFKYLLTEATDISRDLLI